MCMRDSKELLKSWMCRCRLDIPSNHVGLGCSLEPGPAVERTVYQHNLTLLTIMSTANRQSALSSSAATGSLPERSYLEIQRDALLTELGVVSEAASSTAP